MKTVKDVSVLSGVSIRALHHYDAIGLLKPTRTTQAGYRYYDDAALERLQIILLFRQLRFPLREIQMILDSPHFSKEKALEQQVQLLRLQKEQLEKLIDLACAIQTRGGIPMDFSAFDTAKLDEYAAQARATWGDTAAYKEYEQMHGNDSREEQSQRNNDLMAFFRRFGALRSEQPSGAVAQALAAELQAFITARFYTCTPQIFRGLGAMYVAGGEMTENIDRAGGEGTAAFASEAIAIFCADK